MSNTPYVHPNGNQYTTCPCEITSLTDCRSKEDPITYESLEGEPIKNVVVLPSGYCVTTDILKQFRKWEDPLTRMKLSKENKYYELMIDNKPELDPELDPALVQNLIDQIGLDFSVFDTSTQTLILPYLHWLGTLFCKLYILNIILRLL